MSRRRSLVRHTLFVATTLGLAFGAPRAVQAAPSQASIDEMFSELFYHVGLELRGALGGAPSFGGVVFGGDVGLFIEGEHGGVFFGGRLASGGRRQLAVGELGGRYFPGTRDPQGLFVGGGGFYGAEYVEGLAFAIGKVGGGFVEGGIEWPGASSFRLVTSLRVDLGIANQNAISRVAPDSPLAMVSLNLGFFFGGPGTTASRAPVENAPTPP
jgi:hypothetical protein